MKNNNLHTLKTLNPFFSDVYAGIKTFEVRKNDRDFKVYDWVVLQEYDNETGYTGSFITAQITYILKGGQFGIDDKFVVMGFKIKLKHDPTELPF